MKCPYCSKDAELTTGEEVYPFSRGLGSKKFWVCWDCDARVGCHNGTDKALGTMANEELREWRKTAHSTFDSSWKNGKINRSIAYKRLSKNIGLKEKDCHIGLFDISMCKKVVEVCLCGLI